MLSRVPVWNPGGCDRTIPSGSWCFGNLSAFAFARGQFQRQSAVVTHRETARTSFPFAAASNERRVSPAPHLFFLQALFDLEATNNELKSDLRDLYINSAQEVDVSNGRTAIVIHVSSGTFTNSNGQRRTNCSAPPFQNLSCVRKRDLGLGGLPLGTVGWLRGAWKACH